MLVGINVAVFLSPQIIALVTPLTGQTTNKATLLVATLMMFLLAAIQLALVIYKRPTIRHHRRMGL